MSYINSDVYEYSGEFKKENGEIVRFIKYSVAPEPKFEIALREILKTGETPSKVVLGHIAQNHYFVSMKVEDFFRLGSIKFLN